MMISTTYNFKDFCKKAVFKSQLEAIDLVCDEMQRLKIENKRKTGQKEFKEGSQERAYYKDLKQLMSILVNSSLPRDLRSGFLQDIFPLVVILCATNSLMKEILKKIIRDNMQWDLLKAEGKGN